MGFRELAWVSAVPWNRGGEDYQDPEADGDRPEFNVKHGPGRRLTEAEAVGIAAQEVQTLIHKAHLRRADFERHGYTDRCAGCSAILRGLHVQPHSDQCRQRIEKLLEVDVRIKNAKVRLEERGKRVRGEPNGEQIDIKKAQLDDLEAQAMSENGQAKLGEIYSKYLAIYTEWKAEDRTET